MRIYRRLWVLLLGTALLAVFSAGTVNGAENTDWAKAVFYVG